MHPKNHIQNKNAYTHTYSTKSENSVHTAIKNIFNQNKILCIAGPLRNIPVYPSQKVGYNPYLFPQELYVHANVTVMDLDCLEIAGMMIRNGYNPLVINMTGEKFPGGNIDLGIYAQEESLFCRTNYFRTLEINNYPLNGSYAIYSPKVYVFRNTDLNFLVSPFYVSFIAVSAIKDPKLEHGKFRKNDYEVTMNKIELVFQTAMMKGHDSVVLSAFGCGQCHNPVHDIINIFNKVVEKWKNTFKIIVFAVLDKNKMVGDAVLRKKERDSNYLIFKQKIKEWNVTI